jgi:hypothetical protein
MDHRDHAYLKTKEPGIGVHSSGNSTSIFALPNDAIPTGVQQMMRPEHYAATDI